MTPKPVSTATTTCIVCASPSPGPNAVCSLRCAAEAQQEVDRNVARLYRLRRNGAMEDRLRELTERNGRLSQALMRWRSPLTG